MGQTVVDQRKWTAGGAGGGYFIGRGPRMHCIFGSAGSNPAAGREPGANAAPDFSPAGILERRRMMRLNIAKHYLRPRLRTHEGARAKAIPPEQALRRSVLSC